MFAGGTTPDGHQVNADGQWVSENGEVQTRPGHGFSSNLAANTANSSVSSGSSGGSSSNGNNSGSSNFSDKKEHCFTDQLLSYECKPYMLHLFFKSRKPVQLAIWEDSVQKTGDWTFCLDCKFVGQKVTVVFDREHHYEIGEME